MTFIDSPAAVAVAIGMFILVLAGIVVYFAVALSRLTPPERSITYRSHVWYSRAAKGPDTRLDAALSEATALNPFTVQAHGDSRIGLHTTLRMAPSEFRAAVREISQHVAQGRTVSVDVKNLDAEQSVRLVDYCGGVAVAVSGWVFQASDEVFVLTPSSKTAEPL